MTSAARNPAWRWALVTGASAGIGQEIARQLAASGTHVVLVARDRDRLTEQARSYTERYGVHVEVLAADLLAPGDLQRVEARARSTENPLVSVLPRSIRRVISRQMKQ